MLDKVNIFVYFIINKINCIIQVEEMSTKTLLKNMKST